MSPDPYCLHRALQAVSLAYVPCLLLSLLPDLSDLSILSAFGTLAMFFALGSAFIAAVLRLLNSSDADAFTGYRGAGVSVDTGLQDVRGQPVLLGNSSAVEPDHRFPSFADIGGAAASCFYALEGVSMMIPVGNAMARDDVHRYPSLLKGALSSVVAIFAMVAAATALAFPDISSASITADMAARYAGTSFAPLFSAANYVVSAAVVATFPLQLTPVRLIVESAFGFESLGARLTSRVVVVSCCFAVVLAITNLAILIDLVGAVANTVLAALPCAIHAQLLRSRHLTILGVKRNGYTRSLEDGDAQVATADLNREIRPAYGQDDTSSEEQPSVAHSSAARSEGEAAGPVLTWREQLAIAVDMVMIGFCALVACLGVWGAVNHMLDPLRSA
mmetsp:Transcript_17538/g.53004  ORF Transcript_17538/g.53004 Transcript_17538/m.53004 type:complete len:390 (+) Transcript_17538:683-1852(+)|eukprot:scaffold101874_cov35-Tisochrysis_lutea.AAC.2